MAQKMSSVKQYLDGYSSSASIHGFAYIFAKTTRLPDRIIWILAVTVAIYFAVTWSCRIYISWKSDPVLTTIENFAYPIEKIKFPSITICPQGADNNVLRSVLYKQFNEYLMKKNLRLDELSDSEAHQQSLKFVNEAYPGAKQSPANYVTLFRSQDVKSNIRTQANVNPEDKVEQCDTHLEKVRKRRDIGSDVSCPTGTISNEHGKCFHIGGDKSTYSESLNYCENIASDRPSTVHQFLDNLDYTSLYKLMDECKCRNDAVVLNIFRFILDTSITMLVKYYNILPF